MKCKRLSAAILSLVMIISLLPTTALAAEENDVWSTAYDEIRVYMDDATKADHDNLEGILPKQVSKLDCIRQRPCLMNMYFARQKDHIGNIAID